MSIVNLPRHLGLQSTTRLQALTVLDDKVRLREWACLALAGFSAAVASQFFDFSLRIPGHAILRVIFPLAVGLAVVPRRGAGSTMGGFALLGGLAFRMGFASGGELSLGALTSLAVTGPLLDLSLRRARGGWRQYAGFAVAGLSSNLLAFIVRGAAKWFGWEHVGARPFAIWFPQAAVTYTLSGVAAGLISGLVWFCYTARERQHRSAETTTSVE